MAKTLEKRIEQIEKELVTIKKQLKGKPADRTKDWKRTFGRFKDDQIFDAIVKSGAAYRRRQPKV